MQATNTRLESILRTRSGRVSAMLGIALIFQIADLVLTGNSMATIGMWESNPIVLQLMRFSESLWALGAFKTATIVLSFGILYAVRHRWSGELGAAVALCISIGVGMMWASYLVEMQGITMEDIESLRMSADASWVKLS